MRNISACFVVQKKRERGIMAGGKEFKTGYSTTLRIVTIQTLDEYASKLDISRADIGRKIIEYFIEHNDVEDLQN